MPVYHTPGVYFEKVDTNKGKISGIRTDIPGFVGITEKGPVNEPVRLESWNQFQSSFGGFIPQSYLAYAVNGFFENGGDTCYVVRIADTVSAKLAETTLLDRDNIAPTATIKVSAINEGQWGNQIKVYLKETSMGSTTTKPVADKSYSIAQSITGLEKGSLVKVLQNQNGVSVEKYHHIKSVELLSKKIVWEEDLEPLFDINRTIHLSTMEFSLTFTLGNRYRESFANLSLNKDHSRYIEEVINGKSHLVEIKNEEPPSSIPDNMPELQQQFKKGFLYLTGGKDGISKIDIDDFSGDQSLEEKKGLRCCEDVDEVSMICIPDIMIQSVKVNPPFTKAPTEPTDPCLQTEEEQEEVSPPYEPKIEFELPPTFSEEDIQLAQQRMVEHCENMKDRIAILDPPFEADLSEVQDWRKMFDSKYAAFYYPWIRVEDPLRLDNHVTRLIPPSGHIIGLYSRSDRNIGVHKAPANEEVLGAKDVSVMIESHEQEILNPMGINCIRVFPGRGIMVWGARTVSSDAAWRFVNVRRLLIMIEEAVETAMQWAVFEPNSFNLRMGIRISVSSFLEELWRNGALAGSTPEEAFIVKCDEENNPPEVIDVGKILTEIRVAPSIPGEFIIFRIGKVDDRMAVVEEL